MSEQRRFDFEPGSAGDPGIERDRAARLLATDPARHVALEASAGTGKTRVLVDRYVRLVAEAGVAPRHILAITFTRKAAAEMRRRVLDTLEARHREGALTGERWRQLRDAFPEIAIGTIDAFCLSLLYEFPLEAGVEPGFALADETETPALIDAALDRALRVGRGLAGRDPDVALVFAALGEPALRRGLATLLDRRLIAAGALARFVAGNPVSIDEACDGARRAIAAALDGLPGGTAAFAAHGPDAPDFALLVQQLAELAAPRGPVPAARVRAALDRLSRLVLTGEGEPRQRLAHRQTDFRSRDDVPIHRKHVQALGPAVRAVRQRFLGDLNRVMARGVLRLFGVAQAEYRRTLDARGVLDFADVLERALALLEQRDEFSQSRYKLESRYRHLLVDEFQDTSRPQWRLVRELMSAWTAGAGAGDDGLPPSVFIVGDRKQSIYGFRDADVAVLEEAARHIEALRPGPPARAAITRSFRAVRPLLQFVNDVGAALDTQPGRADAFRYDERDRFPLPPGDDGATEALGLVSAPTDRLQAETVADEVARLLAEGVVIRDRVTGTRRAVAPGDVALLFRTRDGHRLFEEALARRHVPSYVYKGLGFYDTEEIKDVLALLGYLAEPRSDLRAAALLRSRLVRISDHALLRLAPSLAAVLTSDAGLPADLEEEDARRLVQARASLATWLPLVDRLPPAELLDRVLAESAYAAELAGSNRRQARENLKKIRAMVRRVQNRGYATLERVVAHFAGLAAGGDESNAIVDAVDAVNLMTVHAAKGLEFPVVFLVNLDRGGGGGRDPVRVRVGPAAETDDRDIGVGIGDYDGDADADAEGREAEETKRLLYVALTRARDRLYLAATTRGGRFVPARGSPGLLLPEPLRRLLDDAGPDAVRTWAGASTRHTLRVVPVGAETPRFRAAVPGPGTPEADDLGALVPDGRRRVTARAASAAASAAAAAGGSSAELGTLVHRLLAEARPRGVTDGAALEALARPLLDSGDKAAATLDRAVALAGGVLASGVLDDLPAAARLVFEAAYSRRLADGTVERGVVDCLIVMRDSVTVLEFKTGGPRPEHAAQLAAYCEAVQALFAGRTVAGRLVYAGAN